jgi:hypothetical protein
MLQQNLTTPSRRLRTTHKSINQSELCTDQAISEDGADYSDQDSVQGDSASKKKDKKLVFLSRSVLKCVREQPNTTGTEIAYKILELYKRFSDRVDFKNVQRRVYDALNVLSAMDVIKKHKNNIIYNELNQFIDDTILPNTVPSNVASPRLLSSKKNNTVTDAPTTQRGDLVGKRGSPSGDGQKTILDSVFR